VLLLLVDLENSLVRRSNMGQEQVQSSIRTNAPQSELSAADIFLTNIGIPHKAVNYAGEDVTGKYKGETSMPQSVPVGMASSPSALFGNTVIPTASMSGEVPSSGAPTPTPQFAGSVTFDPNEVIKQMVQPINPKLYEAAATPTAAGHQFQAPLSLQTPVPGFRQQPMMPTGTRAGVYGKHNARMRGIANALTGVMNAVGEIGTAEAQVKQKSLAMNVQRLTESQQNIDQARQLLQNPNLTPDQKAIIQNNLDKNLAVREEVLKDKSTRNVIEKGSKISFTDPSQNKTKDHADLKQALESYGDQFEKQLPQQLGENKQAVAALEAAKEQQKQQQEAAKEAVKIVQAQYQYSGRVDSAMITRAGALATEQLRIKGDLLVESQKAADSMEALKYHRETQLLLERAREAAANKSNALDAFKIFNEVTDKYTARMAELAKQDTEISTKLASTKGLTPELAQELRGQQQSVQRLRDLTGRQYDVSKSVLATALNLDPMKLDELANPPEIPGVGKGGLSPDATKPTDTRTGGGSSSLLSTNPYTGKAYDKSVPTIDRAIVGGIYGGSEAIQSLSRFGQSLEGPDNPISRGARALEDFFPSQYGTIKRETSASSDTSKRGSD
jgi:hypothetical protein